MSKDSVDITLMSKACSFFCLLVYFFHLVCIVFHTSHPLPHSLSLILILSLSLFLFLTYLPGLSEQSFKVSSRSSRCFLLFPACRRFLMSFTGAYLRRPSCLATMRNMRYPQTKVCLFACLWHVSQEKG